MTTGNQVCTGARAAVYANGEKIGVATGVDITENLRQEPLRVLDKLVPDGFATVSLEVNVRFSKLRIPNRNFVTMGLWPSVDNEESVTKASILDFPELTFRVKDSKTGTNVGTVVGAVPGQRNIRYQPGTVVVEDGQFPAILFGDEGSTNFG